MKTLTMTEAAATIGVSRATLRNWLKAGHVIALPDALSGEMPGKLSGGGPMFAESEILRLKSDLAAGRLKKLCRRANKSRSIARFVPTEYADCDELIDTVKQLLAWRERRQLSGETLLFLAAIRLLELVGDVEIVTSPNDHSQWFDALTWRRNCVARDMRQWHDSLATSATLPRQSCGKAYAELAAIMQRVNTDDDLGVLHQALTGEGEKSNAGSYYTPTRYVSDVLRWAALRPGETLLDPCCGTGKYLVTAVQHFGARPEHYFGFDLDATAVRAARVNLFLAVPQGEFEPRVYCLDTLADQTPERFGPFDVAATNPPWGAYKNAKSPHASGRRCKESFALFLLRSLALLRENGRLSFLLPESFLRIKTHAGIREHVLTQTTVQAVTMLGRGFSGVFTGSLRLDLVNAKPPTGHECRIVDQNRNIENRTQQAVFLQNRDHVFDVGIGPGDREILEKIFTTPHMTLEGNADWALGIVTGDNARHVATSPGEGFEPVLRGSDVERFRLREPASFLRFEPSQYQQVAPTRLYRAPEKLVYRFISTRLTFAHDDEGRLTLNSANVLIPRLPGMSVKVASAFLNSTLFQYVFAKKFATHKVLRGDLERLPFPEITRELHDAIESQVTRILQSPESIAARHAALWKLDRLVFATFPALTGDDVAFIEASTR